MSMKFCGGVETNLLSKTYGTTGAAQVNAIDFSLYSNLLYGVTYTKSDGSLTIYGEAYRGTVMASVHAAGNKFEEVLYHNGYLHSIVGSSTLTTKSATLTTYINNLVTQLTKLYSGHTADGIMLDFENQDSSQTTSDLDIFITHLYAALNPLGKTIGEYCGYYMRYAAPNYLPSPSVANAKLDYLLIGCYALITAAACEAEMPKWAALGYSKNKLLCNITVGVIKVNTDYSTQYYGMYSDLWNSYNNTGITDLSLYSKTFTDFYTFHNPQPGSLGASGWYYGINTTLKWFCVNETKALSQWMKNNGYGGMGVFDISYDMISYPEYSLSNAIYTGLGGVAPVSGLPTFGISQSTSAKLEVTVKPGNLAYQIELFVGLNDNEHLATTGKVTFTSTGAKQNLELPLVMPNTGGTYHVYVDLWCAGILLGRFISTEDINVVEGVIGPITW